MLAQWCPSICGSRNPSSQSEVNPLIEQNNPPSLWRLFSAAGAYGAPLVTTGVVGLMLTQSIVDALQENDASCDMNALGWHSRWVRVLALCELAVTSVCAVGTVVYCCTLKRSAPAERLDSSAYLDSNSTVDHTSNPSTSASRSPDTTRKSSTTFYLPPHARQDAVCHSPGPGSNYRRVDTTTPPKHTPKTTPESSATGGNTTDVSTDDDYSSSGVPRPIDSTFVVGCNIKTLRVCLEDKRFLVIAGALTAASANVLALPLIVHHFQSQGSACTLGVLVEPSLRIVAIVLVGAFGTGGVSGVASHGLRLCRNSPGEEEVSLEDASGEDKLDAESGEGDLSVVCEQVDLDAVGSSDEENRKNKKPQTPDSFKRRSNMQQPDSPTRKFHFGASGASQVGSPTKSLTGVISFDQYSGSPDLFDEQ